MIFVAGHKNPDTDAIVSAICYSDFLNNTGAEASPIKLGEPNNEAKFVIDYWKASMPETKTSLPENTDIALVDHNEASQSLDNIQDLNITSIVDHHKFNLQTDTPLEIFARPLGSTATILAGLYNMANFEINKQTAGLMISAIISDTLYFRSPTTTEEDKIMCSKLNEIAQITDLEAYSLEMFNAKSDLGDISAEELVKMDYKEFSFNGKKVGIGVMETTNPNYAINRIDEIQESIEQIKSKDNLDHLVFSVIDILNEKNTTIVSNPEDKKVISEAFSAQEIESNTLDLENRVSRKKQIVPTLEQYFA